MQAPDEQQETEDSEPCLALPEAVPSLESLQEEDSKQAPADNESRLTHVTENARLVHALLLQGVYALESCVCAVDALVQFV